MGYQENAVATNEHRFGGEYFNLDDENTKRLIRTFEHEMEPFFQRRVIVESDGKGRHEHKIELSGVELYMHENDIFVFSRRYPFGAVRNPEAYRLTKMKWQKVLELRERRRFAEANRPEPISA